MVQYLIALAPTFSVLAFFLLGPFNWSRNHSWTRAITCVVVGAIALRYILWRLFETVLPYPNNGLNFYWVWFLFIIEILAFFEVVLFLVLMSRYVDRSAEADRLAPDFFRGDEDELPTVDVFIPTYNEPLDVLERTIIGALALDYPQDKLKVYVLDDQRRNWLKAYCEEKGAIHVTRPDNSHAKAGNMNNGLKVSSGDFIAIFDADFVPYRHFLRRTLPFFSDATIGIVQTPQHFFNTDPVQTNLGLENIWPDEQRLFFDEIAPSRDIWDVSFCCGSCSIARRKAIDEIGGFPTESITEDLLTTLSMLNKGYKTRYLNERLSMGLAAENLTGYFVQRERWCQGDSNTLSSQRPTARTWSVTFSTHHVPSAIVVGAVSGALYDIDHPDHISLVRLAAALFHQRCGLYLPSGAVADGLFPFDALDNTDPIFACRIECRRGFFDVSDVANRYFQCGAPLRQAIQGDPEGQRQRGDRI
ncbi:glycosyltransferase [Rhizobium ruizarguesonis]|nr:glycosyltransferase [Rhizobium ruizarguesonis]